MLHFIRNKIKNKRWLNLCLLTGISLLAAVFTCHPMIENGSNNRLLMTGFEEYVEENNEFPAVFTRSGAYETADYPTAQSIFERMEAYEDKWTEYVAVDTVISRQYLKLSGINAVSSLSGKSHFLSIGLLRDMDSHINIVKGSGLDSESGTEDVFPCIISESVMDTMGLVEGEELIFTYAVNSQEKPAKFIVTGIFTESSDCDNYWYRGRSHFDKQIFVSEETFDKLISEYGYQSVAFEDDLLLNYTQINDSNALTYKHYIEEFQKKDSSFGTNFLPILENYEIERRTVSVILWVLELPCVVLLLLFIYMVSNQVLQAEEGEIAVLRSRGVTRGQTMRLYVMQSLILSGAGIVLGTLLGYFMCRCAARTDAFLQFVNKDVSVFTFTWKMIPYALAACVIAMLFMTIPVWNRAKITIVEQKGAAVRTRKTPFWEKFFLDVILLGISCYLLYNYNKQSSDIARSVLAGEGLDPMVFLDASLFIFSCGLVFLRLNRYLVRLIDQLGKKRWNPVLYASFLQITRTFHKQSFLSVFLIMTIATGIFNANSARTMNENNEERIRYNIGTDVRLQEIWKLNVYKTKEGERVWSYEEPDFEAYTELTADQVCDSLTRVIEDDRTDISAGNKTLSGCQMMGIHTKEFGETAELLDGLNDTHWFHALNALAEDADGVIISRNVAEQLGLEEGDSLKYARFSPLTDADDADSEPIAEASATVSAIVDSFPGYQQYRYSYDEEGIRVEQENYLIVGNYATIVSRFGITPYSIWMRLSEGASSGQVAAFAEEHGIRLAQWMSLEEEIGKSKGSALIQVTNGMFTMGFLIATLICVVGFLIYWIMSIKNRELLFGIYRAMGMQIGEIRYMLINEQIFSSVLSIVAGGAVGAISTFLFVRLIALVYLPEKHNIAIRVYVYASDMVKLFVVVFAVVILCAFVLRRLLKNMKIAQALKLGED